MATRIPFIKTYSTPKELVQLLKTRGMEITDEEKTEHYLSHIGYYRLSAYMYPLLSYPKSCTCSSRARLSAKLSFGLQVAPFESWLTIITVTRNSCCHHARVWNRVFSIRATMPIRMSDPWITLPTDPLKVYFDMCIIKYFLDIISPNNDMLDKLNKLFTAFPEIDKAALGFPVGWENEPLWQ